MSTLTRMEAADQMAAGRSAEFEVASTDELAALPAEQRTAKLRSMADRVFNAAAIGSFLMARDTTAVVDLVLENPDGFGNAHLELAKAAEEARCFLVIIDVAQRRLAAGLAEIANGQTMPWQRG